MKRITAPLLALALLALAGCAGADGSGGLTDRLPSTVADKLVCAKSERLCAYMAAAVVTELSVDRITNREPQDAIPTMGRLQVLTKALSRFDADGGDWPATTAYQAGRALVLAMKPIVTNRAGAILSGVAAPTPSFVFGELYRVGLAAAMHADIRKLVDEKSETEAIAAMQARIAAGMAKIKAMGELT